MHRLHLPAEHSDIDLVLAGHLADVLSSRDLYVAWTAEGGAGRRPELAAVVHDPASGLVEAVAQLIARLSALAEAVLSPRRARAVGGPDRGEPVSA